MGNVQNNRVMEGVREHVTKKTLVSRSHAFSEKARQTVTVWRQIFEEHNFRGFRGLASNRENYAPRNNAKFSKSRTLPQLQVVDDRSMVVYC